MQEAASFSDAERKCSSFEGVVYNPFISLAAFTDLLEVEIQNPASPSLNSFWISGFDNFKTDYDDPFCLPKTNFAILPVIANLKYRDLIHLE
jgi:hypothetical protein